MSENRQNLSSSSSNLSEDQPKTYKCKKCLGDQIFTQDELEAHRQMHRAQKASAKLRSSSRPSLTGTLFTQVGAPPAAKKKKPVKKRRSNKIYDNSVVPRRYHTG